MSDDIEVTKEMRDEGELIASTLMDAHIEHCLGGSNLGGCKAFDLENYPERHHDLILGYLSDEPDSIQSAEAIYVAMDRVKTKAKAKENLYAELKAVFDECEEYHDNGFEKMVALFAGDPFYKLHLTARSYLGGELTPKEQAIEDNKKAIAACNLSITNLSDVFSGYKEHVNNGEFAAAYKYLNDMPDGGLKTYMHKNISDRETEVVDYREYPLK